MALVFADLVQETTSTTGVGTLTLTGASDGFQTFAAIGNANTTYYRIKSNGNSEVGIGTYTASGTTLSRDTVLYSTAGGTTKITVAAGATVICTYPAEKTVILDASGNATGLGTPAAFVATNVTGLPYAGLTGTVPTWNQSTSGNAATVTNGVYTTGSYADPTWLTSVALTTGTITTAPSTSTDIVNKSYADSIAAGVNFHAACNYATTVALAANTYNNGTLGVGATLTGNANGAVSIDGTAPSATQRVLIKNQVTQANNGVYVVTQVGTTLLPYILTRATDYDTSGSGTNEVDQGDMLLVISGPTNANTSWVQQTPLPITIGTTALVFIEFAAAQTYTAGTGLTLTTNQFSITAVGSAGTYGSSSLIPIIVTNASGQVTGITTAANPQGTVTSVDGTGTVSGLSLSGTVTSTGSITLGGTLAVAVSALNSGTGASAATFWCGNGTWAAPPGGSFTGGTLTTPLVLAAGTATNGTEPLRFQSGPVTTLPSSGSMEFDGTTIFTTTATGNRGVAPSIHYITQTAAYTTPVGTASTLKQLFNATTNGAMTSSTNITYFFECMVHISAMSSTSGNLQFGFLGSAVFSSALYMSIANKTLLTVQAVSSHTMITNTAKTPTVITASNVNTTGYAYIQGKITVTTAGTIIPAFALSIAAAAVVNVGSFFKIWEAGSNTELEIGDWT